LLRSAFMTILLVAGNRSYCGAGLDLAM
jgi:hypothetical protein